MNIRKQQRRQRAGTRFTINGERVSDKGYMRRKLTEAKSLGIVSFYECHKIDTLGQHAHEILARFVRARRSKT